MKKEIYVVIKEVQTYDESLLCSESIGVVGLFSNLERLINLPMIILKSF